MPTIRSVSDIKANLLRPSLTSYFEVEIALPFRDDKKFENFLIYNGIDGLNQTKLNLLCFEATLPGSNLATLEITNDFHGVTERHAYRRVYDDRIDFSFYVDAENYLPIHFFEVWMKYIADESIGNQADKGNVGSRDSNYFYRIRYPEEYIANRGTKVIKFERDYKNTLSYEFINAFPISISSMPVSYDSSSLLKCSVSMSYIRYVLERGSTTPVSDGATGQTAGIGGIGAFNRPPISIAQQAALNSINTPFFGVQPGAGVLPSGVDPFASNLNAAGIRPLSSEFATGGTASASRTASGNNALESVSKTDLANLLKQGEATAKFAQQVSQGVQQGLNLTQGTKPPRF